MMPIDTTHAPVAPAVRPPGRRWRPAAFLQASAALHVGGIAALAAMPEVWPAVALALAANQGVLFGASFAPRSRLLGPNIVRLPEAAVRRGEIAITFDDGPDPDVTPRVLDLLDRAGAKASFFCVGSSAAAFPEVIREIVRRGHSVENHSHRHSIAFGWYGPGRLGREIGAAQAVIAEIAGRAPVFFRAPFGVHTPFLEPVLARLGLAYVSWTRRGYDTVDRDSARVLGRLADRLDAGDILLLHDGFGGRERGREQRAAPSALAVLPRLLDIASRRGLVPVTLAAACSDAPAR